MFRCVFFFDLSKLLEGGDKLLIEIIDCDLVIAAVFHQVLLAGFNYFDELIVLSLVIRYNEVLEDLEEKRPIEAISIPAKTSHVLISDIKRIKALLKLILSVLLPQNAEVCNVANEWHTIVDLFFQLVFKIVA